MQNDIFGAAESEQRLEVLATRNGKRESETAVLAPARTAHAFFAPPTKSALSLILAACACAALVARKRSLSAARAA